MSGSLVKKLPARPPAHVNPSGTLPGYFPYVHGALLLIYSSRIGHYSTILPLRMQEPLLVVARMRNCGGGDVTMMMMISRKPAHTVPSGQRPPEHQKPGNGRPSRREHFKKSTCPEPQAEFWWHMRNFGGIFFAPKKGTGVLALGVWWAAGRPPLGMRAGIRIGIRHVHLKSNETKESQLL